MNKLVKSLVAVAALAAGGAFAQSAECQRGIDVGIWNDTCGAQSSSPRDPWGRNFGVYPNSYANPPAAAVLSGILGANAYPYYNQQVLPRYNPTRRDRDGDGVRNRDDRYPNDPRYR